jgi:hypothetical protein
MFFCNECQTEVQADFFDNVDYDMLMCPTCSMPLAIKMHRESRQEKADVIAEVFTEHIRSKNDEAEIEMTVSEARTLLTEIRKNIAELSVVEALLEERLADV